MSLKECFAIELKQFLYMIPVLYIGYLIGSYKKFDFTFDGKVGYGTLVLCVVSYLATGTIVRYFKQNG